MEQSSDISFEFGQQSNQERIVALLSLDAIPSTKKHVTWMVEQIIAKPDYGFFLVAKQNEEVVGVVMVSYEFSDWRNGTFYWIQETAVAEGLEKEPLERKLLQRLKQIAEDKKGECCGFRAAYSNAETAKWTRIHEELGLTKSHYYLYHADTPSV